MKTAISLSVLALCLMIGLPGAAQAGNGTGACLVDSPNGAPPPGVEDGKFPPFSACVDGLSDTECAALCNLPTGDDPDGGIGELCKFLPGQTCASTGIPWDGACEGTTPIGDLCVLLVSPDPGDSQLICEELGLGTWLGDGSVCGGVPALPKLAYGALALILLAGTLTILTLQSKS